LNQKKRASKRKSESSKSPKKPPKKTSSTSSGKAKKKVGKTLGRRVPKTVTLKQTGGSGKTGSSRKAAKPRGLKAGSDSRAEELRSMLETKRAELLEEIRRARQDSVETDRTSFPEVGDLVSASLEKERAFEYGELGVNALREIDNALEKLSEGTYGICELCGKPIGLRRLKVMPSARLCIECKSKEEASGRKS
jgi:DnaK suppressor protein